MRISKRMVVLLFGWSALTSFAQSAFEGDILQRGRSLFYEGYYEAARQYIERWDAATLKSEENYLQQEEAQYMLMVIDAEHNLKQVRDRVLNYLERRPETIYKNHLTSIVGSSYYAEGNYQEATLWFERVDAERLNYNDALRNSLHYAISLIKIGRLDGGKQYLSIARMMDKGRYADDIIFYTAYLDYLSKNYEQAQKQFVAMYNNREYGNEARLYSADIYIRDLEYNQAIEILTALMEDDVEDYIWVEIERLLGEAYFMNGEYEESSQLLQSYVMSGDDIGDELYYYLGVSYYECGNDEEAIEYLCRVGEQIDEIYQSSQYYIGLASLRVGNKERARMAFEESSSVGVNTTTRERAMYNYALLLYETSYSPFAESLIVFERFLNSYPGSEYSESASNCLVDLYMTTSNYEVALRSIDKIQNPTPSVLEAKQQLLFKYAKDLYINGRYSEAIQQFNGVVELTRYNKKLSEEAYFWRAESQYKLSNIRMAMSDYRNYVALSSNKNSRLYLLSQYGMAYIYYNEKNYPSALVLFLDIYGRASVVKMDADIVADVTMRIADCYFYNRELDKAIEYYNTALGLIPSKGDYLLYQRGLVYGLQHNYEAKIKTLQQLSDGYPHSDYLPMALYEMGRAYRQMDNSEDAIVVFNRISSSYPQSDLARYAATEVAQIYYQLSKYDEAISAYKGVIESYPGSDEQKMALRDLRSIYVERGRVSEFLEYAEQMQNGVSLQSVERDSLSYASAEYLYSRGDYQSAKRLFAEYVEEYPNGEYIPNAWYYQAVIYQRDNDYERALQCYLSASEFDNSRFAEESLDLAASMAYTVGDYMTAIDAYVRLLGRSANVEKIGKSYIGVVNSAENIGNSELVLQYVDKAMEYIQPEQQRKQFSFYKANALANVGRTDAAAHLYKELSEDVRTEYGAEARYILCEMMYESGDLAGAEREITSFLRQGQSTSHKYWLARSSILLSDIYVKQKRYIDAKQYLLSLKRNYNGIDDGIGEMIDERLNRIEEQ